jgi:hypothetical protein
MQEGSEGGGVGVEGSETKLELETMEIEKN